MVVTALILSAISAPVETKAALTLLPQSEPTPSLGDYQEADVECNLPIEPRRVWDSASGTLGDVSFHVIRPDMFLVEGNNYTIPVVLKTDSSQSHTLEVSVRSVPFELISTDNNQESRYNVTGLTAAEPEIICHEFKATWDGRWSIIVAVENQTIVTHNINTFNRLAYDQFNQTRSLAQQTELLAEQADSTAAQTRELVEQTKSLKDQVFVAWVVGILGIISYAVIEVVKSPRARGWIARRWPGGRGTGSST